MSVVFSTYHSIEVIGIAQNEHGLADFDLIICDEAHRTTGATFANEDESAFVRVHDDAFIRGHKRLYMTATPRIYGEGAKASADRGDVTLASMDDQTLFGKNLHTLSFSEAVSRGLLCDYKVIVLSMDEHHINRRLQNLLKDETNTLKVDDAAKIIGCWKALSKHQMKEGLDIDPNPMQRAVAFCQVIEPSTGKKHKVSSKQIAKMFQAVVEAYQEHENDADDLMCEVQHVDGSMNATEKESKINWLKANPEENSCKILSNVRCLSEGVDVPALDAVLFLTPRNSQVDVVQSVGRVMRNAPGKVRGYVILPVVIPAGTSPSEALNDNQTYRVVWEVLQALRSHDDRFDAMINKLDLIGQDQKKMEIVAINDKTVAAHKGQKTKQRKKDELVGKAKNGSSIGTNTGPVPHQTEIAFDFEVGEIERALVAKVVEKCGNRHHWEEWAKDIAKIAQTHISRIRTIVTAPENKAEKAAFKAFVTELRDDLNHAISEDEVIEMLAQHLITEPVFDALFEGYHFGQHNPVSQAMDRVITLLHEHNLDTEADTLESFYASVKMRAEGIDNAAGKQKIIVELYDKFFRNAFPRLTERLGIVYTPVEVVDFIIHSINHLLKTEFNQELGSEGVHILDPFTGTGTFITRLLQSGLIPADKLPHKYANEIHANELVLLAYYIAAINIEAVYHGQVGGEYQPFKGICLTDTFQMYEQEDRIQDQLKENSRRRTHQRSLQDIRVIIGNPPYSIGQRSENDNNDNVAYPKLDSRLAETYVNESKATLSKGLYDSYIRAFRWASDRIGDRGIIGFVTNGGFLDANTADGMRKCLAEEFSSLYVFHLRGNARTSGEQRRKEKDNVFGLGSRTPIAITLLVKNPEAKQHGQIYFHDIGDYLTREEKLEKISQFTSVAGIDVANGWTQLVPDQHGDWLNQRDDSFANFIVMGDKKGGGEKVIFENYSQGVLTARDSWCYNPSKRELNSNMDSMISFYNHEVDRFHKANSDKTQKELDLLVDDFINLDPARISWSRALKKDLRQGNKYPFQSACLTQGLYRPFTKQWTYFDRRFNEMVYQMPRVFPNQKVENLVICIQGTGSKKEFSCIISDTLPNYDNLEKSQCFPLYLYDEDGSNKRDAVTDEGLAHFQSYYPELAITKEGLFYYIYGLFHSAEYRICYGDNLSKELPRIPRVKTAADFIAFEQAGRKLAELHLNYETADCYQATIDSNAIEDSHYRVVKMKHPKVKRDGKNENDLSTIIFNNRITIKNIPEEAYRYVVNGKSAIAWVMERQCEKEDKDSGIKNDANLWATETMGNAKYPFELLLRVITVSLETMRIVDALPALDLE